ncbi:hypothetical protein F5X99DRAFT_430716 [Biscogniauxia marginata]|nr:hypothetical protein F5X99DRAFT_430716 [Biscogniauxia marginata]
MLSHAAIRSPMTLTTALLTIFTLAAATCYRPDGSAVGDIYRPRDESAEFSTCCRASTTHDADHGDNDNNDEYDGDAHASIGLCGVPGTQLWRGSCTDPTWTSPACLNLCADGDYAAAEEVEITTCNDGSFCCGASSSGCCERGEGVLIIDKKIISPPRKREIKPASPPATATRSTRIARRGLSSEAITGLTITGACGVVGALTVAVYVASKWKKASKPTDPVSLPSGALPSHHAVSLAPSPVFAPPKAVAPLYYHSTPLWGSTYGRAELDSSARPQELPGRPAVAALPSRKYSRW